MKQHRFFDREHASWVRRLLPGEFASSRKPIKDPALQQGPEALMTVLGSCVAVCLTDKVEGVIGMNHFMLPQQTGPAWIEKGKQDPANRSARYGSYAMELLINELLAHGAKKDRLAAWIFGGGQILSSLSDIGKVTLSSRGDILSGRTLQSKDKTLAAHWPANSISRLASKHLNALRFRKVSAESSTAN